jgi:hypothetical protein
MQRGSLASVSRKEGPRCLAVSLVREGFAWSSYPTEKSDWPVERYPDGAAAGTAMTIVLAELNSGKARIS